MEDILIYRKRSGRVESSQHFNCIPGFYAVEFHVIYFYFLYLPEEEAQEMEQTTKDTLKQVGNTMFPGITDSYKHSRNQPAKLPKIGHEIVTDLPLQMCLFFNLCYFPFWLITSIVIAYVKFEHLNYLYKFILVTLLVATTIIEITRLYLGYLGNLTEKVPELAGFWLLTVLLQFPMVILNSK